MIFFQSLAIAFSMFSAIPMPQFDWNERNLKYMLLLFPIIGVFVATAVVLCIYLLDYFAFSKTFISIAVTLAPLVVTGGIHMDGFMDTCDALSSNADIDKKLKILTDSHIGGFSVIFLVSYLLCYFAVINEMQLSHDVILLFFSIFVLSRLISVFTLSVLKKAKTTGLLSYFTSNSVKKDITFVSGSLLFILSCVLILSSFIYGVFIITTCLIVTIYWCFFVVRKFKGTTGDLQGFLVQILELAMLFTIVFVQHIP